MLASRVRPCASQFNKFIVPLRARYSSAAEKQYEFLKVSVPRTGVGMSMSGPFNNHYHKNSITY
jgi:enoyl-CoA hydratase